MSNNAVKVFISYRRNDSIDIVERITDVLTQNFHEEGVVRDVWSIKVGTNIRNEISQQIKNCTTVIALIGPKWSGMKNNSKTLNRLFEKDDFVRLELEEARLAGVAILPVIIGNAGHPKISSLPDSLKFLLDLNFLTVRKDPDFEGDVNTLVEFCWEQRKIDHRFLSQLTIPSIPGELLLPLLTLIRSADYARQFAIAIASGATFEKLYRENYKSLQAMDTTIGAWLAYIGEGKPPNRFNCVASDYLFKNYIKKENLVEILTKLEKVYKLRARLVAMLEYYELEAEAFNSISNEERAYINKVYDKHNVNYFAEYIANILNDIDEIEDVVSESFSIRMHQAFEEGRIAPPAKRMTYYFEFFNGITKELSAMIEELTTTLMSSIEERK